MLAKKSGKSAADNDAHKESDVQLDPAHELIQTNQALTEDLQKVQAEFMNYKRRTEEERPQQIAAGKTAAIIKLIPVIDNIERALTHVPEDIVDHEYFTGLAGVHKQLIEALNELGVEKVVALGKEFDPEFMNAVMAVEDDGVASNSVVEVMQEGYVLDGISIREALVKVAS